MAGEKNVLKPTPECSYSLTVKTKLELDQWVNSEAQKQKFGFVFDNFSKCSVASFISLYFIFTLFFSIQTYYLLPFKFKALTRTILFSNYHRAGTYNLKDNTCITFARDLCDFLGVPFQGPQVELQDFLEKHSPMLERIRRIPVLTSLIGLVFLLGSRSSQNVSENVKDKVETLFQVKELMHTQFKLTNSGGIIYDETEGSVPFETSV
jgi:hypothetical protein